MSARSKKAKELCPEHTRCGSETLFAGHQMHACVGTKVLGTAKGPPKVCPKFPHKSFVSLKTPQVEG